MAPKRKRKGASKRKRTAARTRRDGDEIPLSVLKKRLAKLRRLVGERDVKSQGDLWK